MVQHGQVLHYHTDHIGTPQELSNSEGRIVWQARFKAYGALALASVSEVANPLRFQGQYFDEETGLHYNRHRYYDPQCGQFTTQDPIGLAGGLNAYQYAPNPVTWVDPWGLTCKELKPQVIKDIETPYGPAVQSDAPEAIAARAKVENGGTLYRTGTLGKSQTAEAQFWALENPNSAGYAQRYGIPQENIEKANFIETAVLKPGTPFITRPAPGIGQNIGGGIEVVVPENGVKMKYFGTK
ncbi:RHS repeat domain-containing protein [Limnobacter sp.]|uniref:RHS repeat domain-containing protein n=1 Tax=Limnobacter sp. TaxID=2003368 RepID=UPI00351232E5